MRVSNGHCVFLGCQRAGIEPGFVLSCTGNSPTGGPDLCWELSSLKPVLELVGTRCKALWRAHSAFGCA